MVFSESDFGLLLNKWKDESVSVGTFAFYLDDPESVRSIFLVIGTIKSIDETQGRFTLSSDDREGSALIGYSGCNLTYGTEAEEHIEGFSEFVVTPPGIEDLVMVEIPDQSLTFVFSLREKAED
jgi:hypothetical protein